MMYWSTLSEGQYEFARQRAERLKEFYGDGPNTIAITDDRCLTGECGEIAFVNWLRHWHIDYTRAERGAPYDFVVNDYRIEIATTDGWYGDEQALKRRVDKIRRNSDRTDLFVGVAAQNKSSYCVYGWCTRQEMIDAPVVSWRSDAPSMKSLHISQLGTVSSLLMMLNDS